MKQLRRQARKIEQARQMIASTEPEMPASCRDEHATVMAALHRLEDRMLEEIGRPPPLSRR